jgi:hypothetical protein
MKLRMENMFMQNCDEPPLAEEKPPSKCLPVEQDTLHNSSSDLSTGRRSTGNRVVPMAGKVYRKHPVINTSYLFSVKSFRGSLIFATSMANAVDCDT